LRVDALVKTLEALGRFHNLRDRRLYYERAKLHAESDRVRVLMEKAQIEVIDTAASQEFLLGPLYNDVTDCLHGIVEAESSEKVSEAASKLHKVLERWIPPLMPQP